MPMMRATAGARSSASTPEIPISPAGPGTATVRPVPPVPFCCSMFDEVTDVLQTGGEGLSHLACRDSIGEQAEQAAGRLVRQPERHLGSLGSRITQTEATARADTGDAEPGE